MTVIQQQRLIGATLVVLLVAVLAWLVLASVDTQESNTAAESDDPIVFESVVEPISEDTTVTEAGDKQTDATADDSVELSQQSEAKVVIPEQAIESESSAEEETTSTGTIPTSSDDNAEKSPDTSAADELTELAERLDAAETQTRPETDDTDQSETDASPDNANDKKQWVIQLGSFSKHENAQSLQDKLQQAGYDAEIEKAEIDGRSIYRVRLPADDDRTSLEETAAQLAESMDLDPQILTHSP